MKLKVQIALVLIMAASVNILPQRGRIVTEAMTPHRLTSLEMATNTSSGLNVVPRDAYVYMSAENIGNTETINTAAYQLVSQPAASAAVLETVNNPLWQQFKPDVTGAYVVKLTISTASGTHDTTTTYYVSDFVGVGNFADVKAEYPNCMSCHQNHPEFVEIFNRWKVSGHATAFSQQINEGGSHFSDRCIQCHTTGYIPDSDNNGFDDVAANLGWTLGTPGPQKFDSLKTFFTPLTQMATIGCESCHGPGSEHTRGPNAREIAISIKAGNCGQCHDEPWRHNKYAQYENSLHAEAVWSSSFAQGASSQNNNLGNCIRCHDGNGFINFTKGKTTNTTGMVQAQMEDITCAACHDPHGNDNVAQLRYTPANSDTLANGFRYNDNYSPGTGELCMNCHKARASNVTLTSALPTNSRWGPHHSVQSDVFLGQNAAKFGEEDYLTSPHKWAVENSCVGCHMYATVDTSDYANRDKVGGHSFSMHNEETGYDHTASCIVCHGEKASFDEFVAKYDYDGNGKAEAIQAEIDGLINALAVALPPKNDPAIDYTLFKNDPDSLLYTKAFFNYQLISYDGSRGMHNTVFAIDVLRKSIMAIGGTVTDVKLEENSNYTPAGYSLSQNYPNPFNPSTTIQYSLPYESNVKVNIYNVTGELVKELVNTSQSAGTYNIRFDLNNADRKLASGIYFYSIEAKSLEGNKSFRQTKKMVLMK
jgi:hypothetical protein